MHDAVIVAHDVRVVRDTTKALDGVSFATKPGTITGLIGPSGSGKTTLMRAIVGAQALLSGQLTVLDMPVGSKQLRSKMGYVTQAPAVYDDLTALQNLEYFAAMLGLGKQEAGRAIEKVDLTAQTNQLVGSMSGGQRARVSLAVALLGEPQVLVLDEPTVGLDPVLRLRLWNLFRQLANEGRCLLISSHVMDEAEECPELLILRKGKVLHDGSKSDLLARTKTTTVHDAFLTLAQSKAAA